MRKENRFTAFRRVKDANLDLHDVIRVGDKMIWSKDGVKLNHTKPGSPGFVLSFIALAFYIQNTNWRKTKNERNILWQLRTI